MARTSRSSRSHQLQSSIYRFGPRALVFRYWAVAIENTEMTPVEGSDGDKMTRTTVNILACVHTLPADLRKPLPKACEHLEATSDVYQFVIDTRLLWRIWMVDEYEHYWIEVF